MVQTNCVELSLLNTLTLLSRMLEDTAELDCPENFNPLESAVWTLPDWVKNPHKANYWVDDLKETKVLPEEIVGIVIETSRKNVLFCYGSRKMLNQRIPKITESCTKILQVYIGVSFESFQKAEKLYRRTENLDTIEDYLSL